MSVHTVYVELLDEGVRSWRPVQADHLGADRYRLHGPIPANETWAFRPGEVVCCREQHMSDGVVLVVLARATG